MTDRTIREGEHDSVYGSSFALYDRAALLEFLEPFRVRFRENHIDAAALFGGRRCLDAGCGNGRGSLFMLENGAAHVTGVDISDQNVESTKRNLAEQGHKAFAVRRTSLESLPFEDASFDFVWCNGVIMHTANPDACIAELARVLRPGGRMWLYVYGSGGIYWQFVRCFRRILAEVPVGELIDALKLLNYPVRFIAEYADDWKTPFLRMYPDATLRSKLAELGFTDVERAVHGMSYDTCARIAKYPSEKEYLGEGDLRYLAVRGRSAPAHNTTLNVNHIDDAQADASTEGPIAVHLQTLEELCRGRRLAAIAACARLQHHLREHVMSTGERIDVGGIVRSLEATIELLRSIRDR